MEDETVWGPRIDRPEGGWPDGECPIPWAKEGEYQIIINGSCWLGHSLSATDWYWGGADRPSRYPSYTITAYRVRADLHRVQPAEPDVVERMAEALDELLNYSGGADHALEDEYVVDRASAALADYEASNEGAG